MKKKLHRTAAACFVLLLLAGTAQAQEQLEPNDDFNKGGRTVLQFLKIGIGARQAALGEASIASVRDVNSIFWNPANISGIERFEAAFSYTRWLADLNYVTAAIGGRWRGVGYLSLGFATLDYGDITEALVTSTGGSSDTRTGNTFSGGDLLVTLAYARDFTDRLAIGISAKYIHERLWEYSASQIAFDVGTQYDLGYKGLRLAMSAQNFSSGVSYLGESGDQPQGYDLPLLFRIGVSGNLVSASNGVFNAGTGHQLVMSLEAVNTNDYSERLHVGGEYTFADLIALRGGYRFNYAEGNVALGVGLTPRVGNVQMRFDYAYVSYANLNEPHRFTVAFEF